MRIARIAPWFLLAVPAIASANIGIPMLVVAWPAYWLGLLPVIAFEGYLGSRVANLARADAMKTAAYANLWSTFIGIPVVWVGFFIVEMVVGYGLQDAGAPEWIVFPFMAPWLAPTENSWVIYAAFLVLAVPFCIGSIWIETKVALRRHPNQPPGILRKWIREANVWSYIAIGVCAVAFPVFSK